MRFYWIFCCCRRIFYFFLFFEWPYSMWIWINKINTWNNCLHKTNHEKHKSLVHTQPTLSQLTSQKRDKRFQNSENPSSTLKGSLGFVGSKCTDRRRRRLKTQPLRKVIKQYWKIGGPKASNPSQLCRYQWSITLHS